MKYTLILITLFVIVFPSFGQDYSSEISKLESQQEHLRKQLAELTLEIDSFYLLKDLNIIQEIGLPSDNYLEYLGYYLEYSEEHEQALWTMHIIDPRITQLGVGRTNDFRVDPRISTDTADSIDYFTYDPVKDEYDGYGYDRGHLVPSADFRWSKKAMSDTYFYSNMSPQLPDFNRGIWAELENFGRAFVQKYSRPLVVVTIPIFDSDQKIPQSVSGVSIPNRYAKAFLDPSNGKTVGFVLKNTGSEEEIHTFAVSIGTIEELTGYQLFAQSKNKDTSLDQDYWFDVIDNPYQPIIQNTLPNKHFNTLVAPKLADNGKEVWVCGTCAGGYKTSKGNLWLNIDNKFPDMPVSGFISKEDMGHFQFDILEEYNNKQICIKGKIKSSDRYKNVSLFIESSHHIKLYEQ